MKIYTHLIFKFVLFLLLAVPASGQLERLTKVGVWAYYGVTT